MMRFKLFAVEATYQKQDLRRDWEGWVDGYGPSDDKYISEKVQLNIVCASEEQAILKARHICSVPRYKDFVVGSIKQLSLDGVILEMV